MLSLLWVAFTSFTLVLVCHELARGSWSVNVHIVLSYSTPPPAGPDSLTVFIIAVFLPAVLNGAGFLRKEKRSR